MHGSLAVTTIRNRRGRKRREGKRKPSGDLIREISTPPAAIRRLRDAALAGMQDARWGTELGRLFLNERITSEQYNAGCRWEALAIRHSAALGSRTGLPSTSDHIGRSSAPVDPDSEVGLLEAKRHLADLDRYQQAFAAIAKHGVAVTKAVRALCEDGQHLDVIVFSNAIVGLTSLVDHFGLTNQRK